MSVVDDARQRATDAIHAAVDAVAQGTVPPRDPSLGELARTIELRAWEVLDPGHLRATAPHAPVLAARATEAPESGPDAAGVSA